MNKTLSMSGAMAALGIGMLIGLERERPQGAYLGHPLWLGDQCPPRNVLAIIDVLHSEEQDRVFNDQIIDATVKPGEQCDAHLEVLHAYDWTAVYI